GRSDRPRRERPDWRQRDRCRPRAEPSHGAASQAVIGPCGCSMEKPGSGRAFFVCAMEDLLSCNHRDQRLDHESVSLRHQPTLPHNASTTARILPFNHFFDKAAEAWRGPRAVEAWRLLAEPGRALDTGWPRQYRWFDRARSFP